MFYHVALQTFHIDTLLLSERGAEFLYFGGETSLYVFGGKRLVIDPTRRREGVVLVSVDTLNEGVTTSEVFGDVDSRCLDLSFLCRPVRESGKNTLRMESFERVQFRLCPGEYVLHLFRDVNPFWRQLKVEGEVWLGYEALVLIVVVGLIRLVI